MLEALGIAIKINIAESRGPRFLPMIWKHYRVEVSVLEQGVHVEFFSTSSLVTWFCDIASSSVAEWTGYALQSHQNFDRWFQDLLGDVDSNVEFLEQGTQSTLTFTVRTKYETHTTSRILSKLPLSETVGLEKKLYVLEEQLVDLRHQVQTLLTIQNQIPKEREISVPADCPPCFLDHLRLSFVNFQGEQKARYHSGTPRIVRDSISFDDTSLMRTGNGNDKNVSKAMSKLAAHDIVAASSFGTVGRNENLWVFWTAERTAFCAMLIISPPTSKLKQLHPLRTNTLVPVGEKKSGYLLWLT